MKTYVKPDVKVECFNTSLNNSRCSSVFRVFKNFAYFNLISENFFQICMALASDKTSSLLIPLWLYKAYDQSQIVGCVLFRTDGRQTGVPLHGRTSTEGHFYHLSGQGGAHDSTLQYAQTWHRTNVSMSLQLLLLVFCYSSSCCIWKVREIREKQLPFPHSSSYLSTTMLI